MKNAPITKSNESTKYKANYNINFYTDNQRHVRALKALLSRPQPREMLDRVVGCSNAPELVAELRRRGLEVPCEHIEVIDRDGKVCRPGIYSLSARDQVLIRRWLAESKGLK